MNNEPNQSMQNNDIVILLQSLHPPQFYIIMIFLFIPSFAVQIYFFQTFRFRPLNLIPMHSTNSFKQTYKEVVI